MAMSLHGGDQLRTKLNGIAEKLSRGRAVNVGFLEGAAPEPDGTPVATIAAINEYGNPANGQPPRPFFRQMIQAKKDGWGVSFNAALQASNMDAAKALRIMGEGMRGQLIESINDFSDPKLSPVTVLLHQRFPMRDDMTFGDVMQARHDIEEGEEPGDSHSNPLVWTGHMRDSVAYEVKGG